MPFKRKYSKDVSGYQYVADSMMPTTGYTLGEAFQYPTRIPLTYHIIVAFLFRASAYLIPLIVSGHVDVERMLCFQLGASQAALWLLYSISIYFTNGTKKINHLNSIKVSEAELVKPRRILVVGRLYNIMLSFERVRGKLGTVVANTNTPGSPQQATLLSKLKVKLGKKKKAELI